MIGMTEQSREDQTELHSALQAAKTLTLLAEQVRERVIQDLRDRDALGLVDSVYSRLESRYRDNRVAEIKQIAGTAVSERIRLVLTTAAVGATLLSLLGFSAAREWLASTARSTAETVAKSVAKEAAEAELAGTERNRTQAEELLRDLAKQNREEFFDLAKKNRAERAEIEAQIRQSRTE